jgi:hypothetical protein
MPRRLGTSTEAVSKPSGRGALAEASVPRLTSRLMSAVRPPIDGVILAARRRPIGSDTGATLRMRPQLAPSEAAQDAGDPESQNRAEADASHDVPPNPGRKIVHGVVSPCARTRAMLTPVTGDECEHAVATTRWSGTKAVYRGGTATPVGSHSFWCATSGRGHNRR